MKRTGSVYYNEQVGTWFFCPNDDMRIEYEIRDWGTVPQDNPYGNIVAEIIPAIEEADLLGMV